MPIEAKIDISYIHNQGTQDEALFNPNPVPSGRGRLTEEQRIILAGYRISKNILAEAILPQLDMRMKERQEERQGRLSPLTNAKPRQDEAVLPSQESLLKETPRQRRGREEAEKKDRKLRAHTQMALAAQARIDQEEREAQREAEIEAVLNPKPRVKRPGEPLTKGEKRDAQFQEWNIQVQAGAMTRGMRDFRVLRSGLKAIIGDFVSDKLNTFRPTAERSFSSRGALIWTAAAGTAVTAIVSKPSRVIATEPEGSSSSSGEIQKAKYELQEALQNATSSVSDADSSTTKKDSATQTTSASTSASTARPGSSPQASYSSNMTASSSSAARSTETQSQASTAPTTSQTEDNSNFLRDYSLVPGNVATVENFKKQSGENMAYKEIMGDRIAKIMADNAKELCKGNKDAVIKCLVEKPETKTQGGKLLIGNQDSKESLANMGVNGIRTGQDAEKVLNNAKMTELLNGRVNIYNLVWTDGASGWDEASKIFKISINEPFTVYVAEDKNNGDVILQITPDKCGNLTIYVPIPKQAIPNLPPYIAKKITETTSSSTSSSKTPETTSSSSVSSSTGSSSTAPTTSTASTSESTSQAPAAPTSGGGGGGPQFTTVQLVGPGLSTTTSTTSTTTTASTTSPSTSTSTVSTSTTSSSSAPTTSTSSMSSSTSISSSSSTECPPTTSSSSKSETTSKSTSTKSTHTSGSSSTSSKMQIHQAPIGTVGEQSKPPKIEEPSHTLSPIPGKPSLNPESVVLPTAPVTAAPPPKDNESQHAPKPPTIINNPSQEPNGVQPANTGPVANSPRQPLAPGSNPINVAPKPDTTAGSAPKGFAPDTKVTVVPNAGPQTGPVKATAAPVQIAKAPAGLKPSGK